MKKEQYYRGEDIPLEFYASKSIDGEDRPLDLNNYDITARIYTSYSYCLKAAQEPAGEEIPLVKEGDNKFSITVPKDKSVRFSAGTLKVKLTFTSIPDDNVDIEVLETVEIL